MARSSAAAMKTSIKFAGKLKSLPRSKHSYPQAPLRFDFRPQSGVCLSTRTAALAFPAATAETAHAPRTAEWTKERWRMRTWWNSSAFRQGKLRSEEHYTMQSQPNSVERVLLSHL